MEQKKKGSKIRNIVIDGRLADQKIRLRVSCSIDGWKALYKEYFNQRPRPFDPDFYHQFVKPALEEIHKEKSIHNNHSFVLMMKAQAAILYLFFRPYFTYRKNIKMFPELDFDNFDAEFRRLQVFMKQHEMPLCFVRFDEYEKFIDKDIREVLKWRMPKSKHNPVLYVAYCMQTVYQELLDKNGIKYFIEPADRFAPNLTLRELDNFHKTYISQGVRLWKEHLKIAVAELRYHKKHNSMELRPHTHRLTTFEKSLGHLYAFHYSKIQPNVSGNTAIFNFVGHVLRAMRFILSEGSGEALEAESKNMCSLFSAMFKDRYEILPYHATLSRDERFILTQASLKF